jgi:hypothetical protein
MSPFNIRFTLLTAFLASLIGLLRVLKRPQFSKEYLARVFQNNHGQNLLYVSFGSMGFVNYLYYAPIAIFFAFGVSEFIKIKFPSSGFNYYGDLLRYNKYYVYEGKGRIEIFFFIYLVLTLPFDFMGRAIKAFLIGQFLFIKYRISPEFTYSCRSINNWILAKTYPIGFLNSAWIKVGGWIHSYATRDISPQQAQAQPEAQPQAQPQAQPEQPQN